MRKDFCVVFFKAKATKKMVISSKLLLVFWLLSANQLFLIVKASVASCTNVLVQVVTLPENSDLLDETSKIWKIDVASQIEPDSKPIVPNIQPLGLAPQISGDKLLRMWSCHDIRPRLLDHLNGMHVIHFGVGMFQQFAIAISNLQYHQFVNF